MVKTFRGTHQSSNICSEYQNKDYLLQTRALPRSLILHTLHRTLHAQWCFFFSPSQEEALIRAVLWC